MRTSCTGPSGIEYHLDDAGTEDCEVQFTIHTHTESEDDVTVDMKDVLFLAAAHIRALRGDRMGAATDLEILGLHD